MRPKTTFILLIFHSLTYNICLGLILKKEGVSIIYYERAFVWFGIILNFGGYVRMGQYRRVARWDHS
jgi:hypothetical protein